jgi:type VI secretion system secreted protein Hcp
MTMAIYMKMDGVKGQSTTEGHKDEVVLESFQFGVNRQIASSAKNANREAAPPSLSEVVVTKSQDAASSDIMKLSLAGEGKKAVFSFTKSGTDGKPQVYMTVTLENCLISSFSCSAHGGEGNTIPMESLSINFTKIEYKMLPSDPKNKTAAPMMATYDIATGKVG